VDVWVFIDALEVSDVTVTLSSEEEDRGVVIVKGHEDSRCRVDRVTEEGLGKVSGVPQTVFSLGRLCRTACEELLLCSEEDQTRWLDAKMGFGFLNNRAGSGVDDSDLLVLGRSGQKRSTVVPVNRQDEIRVLSIDRELGLSLLNIPDLDGKVTRRGGNQVVGDGVELDGTDLSLVAR